MRSAGFYGGTYPARAMRVGTPLLARALIVGVAAVALLLAGCGSSSSAPVEQDATLVLDFTPNAIHTGIYSAIARTFDVAEGVHLHIVVPSASTDSIKLLETGR